MGDTTNIEWARSTFNAWIGCDKVSPGCALCYAERDSAKFAQRAGGPLWGPGTLRLAMAEAYWKRPLQWQREQAAALFDYASAAPLYDEGELAPVEPWRVFVNSMSDVFEDRDDLDPHRMRLAKLVEECPDLTWLLLTKRSREVVVRRWPWMMQGRACLRNIWLGVSVESADYWHRLEVFERLHPTVAWVSLEPLIGDPCTGDLRDHLMAANVRWLVIGGESDGPRQRLPARPMSITWVRYMIDLARELGIAVFVKQLGSDWARRAGAHHPKGGDPAEWPADLRVREFPAV